MRIVITDHFQATIDFERDLIEQADMTLLRHSKDTLEEEAVIALAGDADVLLVQCAPMTRKVMEALPNLRLVSLPQIGLDTVDLEAARELGIWVAHVPDGNITEVAAHALAMGLSLLRRLPDYDRSVRAGEWDYESIGALQRPNQLTLGVVGMGKIGRLLADYGQPVLGRVVGFDPYVSDENWPSGVERVTALSELTAMADLVSIHMPLTTETENLVDSGFLAGMKKGASFVNVSRGPIVDTTALIAAIDSGHLANAALDVFPQEPPAKDDPVIAHPKILLSPHAAFYSLQSDEELRRRSVENIVAFRDKGRPDDVAVEGSR